MTKSSFVWGLPRLRLLKFGPRYHSHPFSKRIILTQLAINVSLQRMTSMRKMLFALFVCALAVPMLAQTFRGGIQAR